MAGKIRGITIELSADATGLMNSLKGINSEIKSTGSQLRDVDRLLKLDPTNTTLLTQKTQLLQEQISNTKEKLDQLKQAQADMDANGVDKNSEQYQALQREIIATEQDLKKLEGTAGSSSAALAKISAVTGEIGEKMENAGKKMSVLSAGIVAFGTAAVKSFESVDEGMDIVIKKTGATGDAAKTLEKNYKNVAKNIVAEFTDIGTALGEVSTRFGLTGTELEDLSEEFLKFADISSMDVNSAVQGVDMALKTFNVDQSEAKNVMGLLSATAQRTGISMDTMLGLLQSSGPTLKEMGLSIGEAIVLMGNFEAAGIDSSTMISKMSKAAAYFNSKGLDMREGLTDLIKRLQNSSTEADATAEAYEIFGSKAGLAFITAAKEGKINLEDLSGSLDEYASVVDNTYEATLDGTDKMKLAWQNVKLGLAEFGSAIGEVLAPIMDKLTGVIQNITEWFSNLSDETKNTIVTIGLVVAAIGPLLVVGGKLMKGISSITAALSKVGTSTGGLIGMVIAAVAALTAGTIALVDQFKEASFKIGPYAEELEKLKTAHEEFVDSMDGAKTTYETTSKATEANAAAAEYLMGKLQGLVAEYDGTATKSEIIAGLVDQLNGLVPGLGLAWDGVTGSLSLTNEELERSIENMRTQAEIAALQQLYTDTLLASYEVQQRYATSTEILTDLTKKYWLTFEQLDWAMQDGQVTADELVECWGGVGLGLFKNQTAAEQLTEAYKEQVYAADDLAESNETIAWTEEMLAEKMGESVIQTNTAASSLAEIYKETFGKDIPQALDDAISKAEYAGIEIPQYIIDGLLDGSIGVKEAVVTITDLLNQSQRAEEAGTETGESYVEATASVVVDERNQVAAAAQVATEELDTSDQAEKLGSETGSSYNEGLASQSGNITGTASNIKDNITGTFADLPGAMNTSGSNTGSELNSGFGGWNHTVSGTVDGMYNLFYLALGQMLPPLMGQWGNLAGERYNTNLKGTSGNLSATVSSLVNTIRNGFSSLPSYLQSIGYQAGSGLYSGLSAWSGALSSLAWNIANSINSAARAALQIRSPSKVMEQIGRFTGEGLEEGLQKSQKGVLGTADSMIGDLIAALKVPGLADSLASTNAVTRATLKEPDQAGGSRADLTRLTGLLVQYLPYLAEDKNIRFDNGTWAGVLAPAINEELEGIRVRSDRG